MFGLAMYTLLVPPFIGSFAVMAFPPMRFLIGVICSKIWSVTPHLFRGGQTECYSTHNSGMPE
jgi:hypothetical protein